MKTICNFLTIVCLVFFYQNVIAQIKNQCNTEIGKISKDNQAVIRDNCDMPYNSENEYDSVGIYHNEAMEYISRGTNGKFERSAVYELARKYITQTFSGKCPAILKMIPPESTVDNAISNPADYGALIEKTTFSGKGKDYLFQLLELFTDSTKNYDQYCVFKNEIVSLERKISADESINKSSEFASIMAVTSIARYSSNYWYNNSLPVSSTLGKFRLFRWLFVAVFDVGGAISGGLLGPVGAVVTSAFFSAGAAAASTP